MEGGKQTAEGQPPPPSGAASGGGVPSSSVASSASQDEAPPGVPDQPPLKSKRLGAVAPRAAEGEKDPSSAADGGPPHHELLHVRSVEEWTEEDEARARAAQREEAGRVKHMRAVRAAHSRLYPICLSFPAVVQFPRAC